MTALSSHGMHDISFKRREPLFNFGARKMMKENRVEEEMSSSAFYSCHSFFAITRLLV
jgi:hypothetical protein